MAGRWFLPGSPISSTNKTDHHSISEIMLKVALNTLSLTLLRSHFNVLTLVLIAKERSFEHNVSFLFWIVSKMMMFCITVAYTSLNCFYKIPLTSVSICDVYCTWNKLLHLYLVCSELKALLFSIFFMIKYRCAYVILSRILCCLNFHWVNC